MLSEGACETELAPGHRGPAGLSFQPALRNAVSSVPRPEERKLEEQACYANTTLPSFPAIRPRSHRVCGHVTLHGEDAREPTQPVGVRRAWRPSLPADPLPTFPLSSPGPRHPESRGDHDTPGCTGVWKGFFFFKKVEQRVAAARRQLSPRGSPRWPSGRVPGTLAGLLWDGAACGFSSHPRVLPL